MKSSGKLLAIFLFVSMAAVAGFEYLQQQSRDGLLETMALVQPGTNLNAIRQNLGNQLATYDDSDLMTHMGSVKDSAFCQGKRLYRFTKPSWLGGEVEVYTDKNDTVVFVTWQQE